MHNPDPVRSHLGGLLSTSPPRALGRVSLIAVLCAMPVLGCDDAEEGATEAEAAPLLGLLELPVSLRSGGSAPSNAHKVEVSPDSLRVNGEEVVKLEGGKVAAADAGETGIAKLTAALKAPARGVLGLDLHSSVPYHTTALIFGSAAAAGIHDASLHVRKPGGGTEDGYLEIKGFSVAPQAPDGQEVAFDGLQPRGWSDFTTVWEAVAEGCGAAASGNCAYKPEKVAEGGMLKLMLMAAGQGVNVNVFRTGEPVAEAPEKPKVEMEDGVPADPVAEVENAAPAEVALFQFRASEALASPSPVSETVKPLCGSKACGAVIRAERRTMSVRLVSLIGAAFPDGSAAPSLHFEIPAK